MNDKTLGAYERNESPDYADGGVAAALIEKEAQGTVGALIAELEHHRARAEKAEKERDEARRERDSWRAQVPLADWEKDLIQATENPRALTPDAITDEMVLRFMNTYDRLSDGSKDAPSLNHFTAARTSLTRSALTAALTEPPARPEELTRLIDTIREATYDPEPVATGEALYNAGVRVVGEERS